MTETRPSATDARRSRLGRPLRGLLRRRRAEVAPTGSAARRPDVAEGPAVDIAPNDPVLHYFRDHPEPVALEGLRLDSPGVDALREAGVAMVVPLVTQGELIGLLNLGPRLSEQDYSADDRRLLENLAGQAAPALRVAQLVREQQAEARRRERYEQELAVATMIQQNFLPREVPEPPGWHLDAFYRPAREVGGDFYDFIDLPDGRLAVVAGDVTDKGVPAALVMASTRSILRAAATRLAEPGAVLGRVNEQLCGDMPDNMFVTCLYGVLDAATGRFRFANAGHNLPCVQTHDGVEEPRATGMPLGLLPGLDYEEAEVTVGRGANLVLYSDALPEAHAPDREMFGFPRVAETVGDCRLGGEVITALLDALDDFTGPAWEQEDDITIVTLCRGGAAAHAAPAPVTVAPLAAEDHEPGADADDPGRVLAEFTVRSETGNEREAIGQVSAVIGELGLDQARMAALETAVGEATMNAIEHGNANVADLLVEVRVWTDEDVVVVRITDQGRGGPLPVDSTPPDLEAKLAGDDNPRGWGLFLIRNMVDDVHVSADDDRQIVELVMRLNGAPR